MSFDARSLPEAFRDVVADRADEPALLFEDEPITYGTVLDRAARFASGLVEHGHEPGDSVAIWVPNRPAWFEAFLGCAMLGTPAVAVNSRYRTDELEHVLADSGATTLVIQPSLGSRDYPSMVESVCPAVGANDPADLAGADGPLERVYVVGADDELPAGARPFDAAVTAGSALDGDRGSADVPCGVFYTSGTTSDPKGVVHRQRSVVRHAEAVADWFGVTDDDVGLLVMPVYGLIGFDFAWSVLLSGGTLAVHQRFDAERAAATVEREGVSYLFGVGDVFDGLLATDRDLTSLERGSAILASAEQLRAVEERCGFPIVQPYGSTELHSHVLVSHPDDPQDERVHPGGPPVHDDIEAVVRDPDAGDERPPGEGGELFVRGYPVMSEYVDDPVATAAVRDDDGWFATGDLCAKDRRGRVRYRSRLGDVFRVRGHLVAPDEIEGALGRHESVAEAVVVGVDAGGHQHRPVAFVRLAEGATATADGLLEFLDERIADYKVPERLATVDALPTATGPNGEKVQRDVLIDRAERLLAAD